jgi:hypothetical protein
MQKDFEARLKLEEGVEGVRKLMTYEKLSEVFADGVQDMYLNIVVERPATGESEYLIGHRNSDDSISWFFHLVSGFPLRLVLTDANSPIQPSSDSTLVADVFALIATSPTRLRLGLAHLHDVLPLFPFSDSLILIAPSLSSLVSPSPHASFPLVSLASRSNVTDCGIPLLSSSPALRSGRRSSTDCLVVVWHFCHFRFDLQSSLRTLQSLFYLTASQTPNLMHGPSHFLFDNISGHRPARW